MKVHKVEKARDDIPGTDIKKGDTYYWWKSFRGPKRVSKTPPRASQTTASEFLSTVYGVGEELEDAVKGDDFTKESVLAVLESAKDEVESAQSECQEKFDNMPEGLQQGDTGQLLENRCSQCDEVMSAIDQASSEVEDQQVEEDGSYGEDARENIRQILSEIDFGSFE
jgi:hypothetical protein